MTNFNLKNVSGKDFLKKLQSEIGYVSRTETAKNNLADKQGETTDIINNALER